MSLRGVYDGREICQWMKIAPMGDVRIALNILDVDVCIGTVVGLTLYMVLRRMVVLGL